MKVSVIGYSGSGKSTVAKKISGIYNIPLLYLDTVRFMPNWVERPEDECLKIVSEFLKRQTGLSMVITMVGFRSVGVKNQILLFF